MTSTSSIWLLLLPWCWYFTSTAVAMPLWWKRCEMLEMTYEFSNDTTNYPIKDYTDHKFNLFNVKRGDFSSR